MKKNITWDGNADTANKIFGESYGTDWAYLSSDSSDIIVKGKVFKVGDVIT